MKAYRGDDGKIRLFRPMENMKRMKRSAVAASLPVSYMYCTCMCMNLNFSVSITRTHVHAIYCSFNLIYTDAGTLCTLKAL